MRTSPLLPAPRPAVVVTVRRALVCVGCLAAGATGLVAQPTVAQFEQAYAAKMQELRTQYVRTVLFQRVQPRGGGGRALQFRVTALVHDYTAGYPPNHYYGQTCVGRVTDEEFTMRPDGYGGWVVQGRMTPPERECKDNPAAGVSAIPVESLGGTRAPTGSAASAGPAAPPVRPVPDGRYECWSSGTAAAGLNFTVTGAGRYRASDGSAGTFRYDPTTGGVAFTGFLQGAMPAGFTAAYAQRGGTPTVSFVSARGAEGAYCENTGR